MKTIKNYQDIRKEAQDKHTTLFNECGVFWAFSNEQFAEGLKKTTLAEGEKLASIGAGGYLPKSKVEQLKAGMKNITLWEKTEIKKMKDGKRKHIIYELNNHECFYTGSIEGAEMVLPYPRKDILKVYHEERKTHEAQ